MDWKRMAAAPLAVIIVLAFSVLPTSSRSDKPLAFIHITLLDVTTGELKPDMTVLTSGGRITDVGEAAALRGPGNARVIAGSGKYMIPALWNMHVHSVSYKAAAKAFPHMPGNGRAGG